MFHWRVWFTNLQNPQKRGRSLYKIIKIKGVAIWFLPQKSSSQKKPSFSLTLHLAKWNNISPTDRFPWNFRGFPLLNHHLGAQVVWGRYNLTRLHPSSTPVPFLFPPAEPGSTAATPSGSHEGHNKFGFKAWSPNKNRGFWWGHTKSPSFVPCLFSRSSGSLYMFFF